MFTENSTLTTEELKQKAREKLAPLSLEEKVRLLGGNWQMIRDSILYKRTYNPVPITSNGNKKHKIKPIAFTDGPRGVVMGKSTCFPVSMARAASFDRSLERRVGEAIGIEARAGGANYFGGVCVNLLMHPAGGRAQESYGEDPYLVGEMGAQLVQGVQHHNVMACAKHYAVNNMENKRFSVNVDCTERTLREVYLPHFKKCVDAGTASLMGSYNCFRGDHASESAHLLTKILRDDWGFEGFVITDFIFALRDGAKAMNAGMDVEMPIPVHYGEELLLAVRDGRVSERRIDEACERLVVTQLAFELAKDPLPKYGKELINGEAHRALAREAAEESMVLIKNEGGMLPLSKDIKRLLVAGHLAEAENTGDHGSSRVYAEGIVTALEGLRAYLGESVEVVYVTETDLTKAKIEAKRADAVLVVAGNDYNDEGECVIPDEDSDINSIECMARGFLNNGHKLIGKAMMKAASKSDAAMGSYTSSDGGAVGGDRKSLSLKPAEIDLIRTVSSVNPKTVVSLVCGSLLMTKEWDTCVPAILYSWYSGEEGGLALAKVLFGEVNPSGHLPFAIPEDEAHLPAVDFAEKEITYDFYHGYRKLDREGHAPMYPFGHGLSYTTFDFGAPEAFASEGGVSVSLSVTNTGSCAGKAVAQVYYDMPDSAVDRFVRTLCGFEKIELEPGETKRVEVFVPASEFMYFDEEKGSFVLEPGTYGIWAGASEAEADLKRTEVSLGGVRRFLKRRTGLCGLGE